MANEMMQVSATSVAPIQMESPLALRPSSSGEMVQASEAVARAMVQMQVAQACPRNEVRAIDRAKRQCLRPGLAKVAIYSYARGGTQVEGPSTRLIEAIANEWGHMECGYTIIERGEDYTKIRAYCTDLQSNNTRTREETIKHYRMLKGGQRKLLTDERDIREFVASWAVRAERACQEKIIPRDVIEECMEVCNATLAMDDQNTDPKKIKALVAAFSEFGVTVPMIEEMIQRHVDAILPAQVVHLRKIYQGLKDGYSSVEQFFKTTPTEQPHANAEPKKSETDRIADSYGLKKGSSLKTPEKKPDPAAEQHSETLLDVE